MDWEEGLKKVGLDPQTIEKMTDAIKDFNERQSRNTQ
jgi:hypothetical protein